MELLAPAYKRPQTTDLNPTTGTILSVPSALHQPSDTCLQNSHFFGTAEFEYRRTLCLMIVFTLFVGGPSAKLQPRFNCHVSHSAPFTPKLTEPCLKAVNKVQNCFLRQLLTDFCQLQK